MTRGQGLGYNGRKPKAPSHLSDMERAIWHGVCRRQSAEWCELAAAGACLEMYCVAVAHYRYLVVVRNKVRAEHAEETEAPAVLDKLSASIATQANHVAMLSTKLRLTPQSQIQPRTATNEAPAPWDLIPEDDGDTT
jgi:phage terminase small subunit